MNHTIHPLSAEVRAEFGKITGKQNQLLDCLAKEWTIEQVATLQKAQPQSVQRRVRNLCRRFQCSVAELTILYNSWINGNSVQHAMATQFCREFLSDGTLRPIGMKQGPGSQIAMGRRIEPGRPANGKKPVSRSSRARPVQPPYHDPRSDIAPVGKGTSRKLLAKCFPDNDACLEHIFHARMAGNYRCFGCGQDRKWYRTKAYRRYGTACCGVSFAPTGRTVMHRSRIPLTDWFEIMLLFANSKNGVTGHFIERHLGIAYKSGFRMGDRIRTHMALLEGSRKIGGPGKVVHVDEALLRGVRTRGARGGGRAIILGMCDDRAAVAIMVPDRKAATLLPLIERHILPGSIIVTDGYHSYSKLAARGWAHEVVNHSRGEWVNSNGYGQASIEAYWGVLKRTIRGTHLHVSRNNLWKYIGEFNFRYNRRHIPYEIFWDMISDFPDFDRQEELRIDLPFGPILPRARKALSFDTGTVPVPARMFRN